MSENAQQFQDIAPGTVINGYRIDHELGRGAMAVVYLAEQLDLERQVAFKILSAELAADKEFIGRFFNEARAAATLSHPHIIQAYDAGSTPDGLYYFCMEYCDGESMLDMVNRLGPLPIPQAVSMLADVADALSYGWESHKFTHGDIKPENIMVTSRGEAKLADFGLARTKEHDVAGTDVMLTPLYAAPELIRGESSRESCAADIYAFGATLYHVVAGSPPFPGTNAQEVLDRQLNEKPQPLSSRRPDTPPALSALVGKMLQKDPAARPRSWKEIISALRSPSVRNSLRLGSKPSSPSPARVGEVPQAQTRSNHTGLILAILIAVVLIAVILLFALRSKKTPPPPSPQPEEQITIETPAKKPAVVETPKKTPEPKPAPEPKSKPAEPVEVASVEEEPVPVPQPISPIRKVKKPVKKEPTEVAATEQNTQPEEQENTEQPPKESAKEDPLAISFQVPSDLQATLSWLDVVEALPYRPQELPQVEKMMSSITNWLEAHPEDTPVRQFMLFAHDTVLPALESLRPLLVKRADAFAGVRLLTRQRNLKVEFRSLNLEYADINRVFPQGSSSERANWGQLWSAGVVWAACQHLLQKQKPATLKEAAPMLAGIAFSSPPALENFLKEYVNDPDVSQWQKLANILKADIKPILSLHNNIVRLQQACANDSAAAAADLLTRILDKDSKLLSEKDSQELRTLLDRLSPALPANQAGLMARKAQEALDAEEPLKAARLAARAHVLFGQENFPEKRELVRVFRRALASIPAPDGFSADAHNPKAFPFLVADSGEKTYAYYRAELEAIQTDNEGKRHYPKIFQDLSRLALLDFGSWDGVEWLLDEKAGSVFKPRPGSSSLLQWSYASYLFAQAIVADRLSSQAVSFNWEPLLKNTLPQSEEQNPHILSLAAAGILMAHLPPDTTRTAQFNWKPTAPLAKNWGGTPARRLAYQAFTIWKEDSLSESQTSKAAQSRLQKFRQTLRNDSESFGFHDKNQLSPLMEFLSDEPPLPDLSQTRADYAAHQYAIIRASLACVPSDAGLDGTHDDAFLDFFREHALEWPLAGGDAIHAWLLNRVAFCLRNRDVPTAIQLTDKILALKSPCLTPRYIEHLFLRAGLLLLTGKNGGVQTTELLLRASSISTKEEQAFLRAITGSSTKNTPEQILKRVADGRPLAFWGRFLLACQRKTRDKDVSSIMETALKRIAPTSAERALATAMLVE